MSLSFLWQPHSKKKAIVSTFLLYPYQSLVYCISVRMLLTSFYTWILKLRDETKSFFIWNSYEWAEHHKDHFGNNINIQYFSEIAIATWHPDFMINFIA